jgi:hypothetical protein
MMKAMPAIAGVTVFVFAFFSGFYCRGQLVEITTNPDHWKAHAEAEKRYSLATKKWIAAFKFTNVSEKRDRLMTSNGALMYRVTAFMLNEAGERSGEVKTRTFSAFPLHNRYTYAEPGGVIWTECNIREWLVIEKPGWYEVHVGHLLGMKDAGDNAVGLPVKNFIKVLPFKIEVVR